jgi:energy-coupling factor transporter ATP-binding protein EcfA2
MSLDMITLPIGELKDTVKSAVDAGIVLVVVGPPGVGKTQIMAQSSAELKRRYTEMLVAGRDTGDVFMSYVDPHEGTLVQKLNPKIPYVGNPEFAQDTPVLLNIDEFSGGTRLMQNILLKVLDERMVGDTYLRDDVAIVATGNRAWDHAHVEQLSAALGNRATFVTVEPDLDAFITYGLDNDFHPLVLAWVKNDPTYLLHFDQQQFLAGDPAFCSPRSNERLSKILKQRDLHGMSDVVFRSLVCGTIGNSIGIKFTGWAKIWHEMPDCDAIAQGDKTQPVPKDPSVVYAVLFSLLQRCTKPTLANVLWYVSKLPSEWRAMYISQFTKSKPELVSTSAWGQFLVQASK